MVFSDPRFLYLFLPACLVVYWSGAWRRRNLFLLIAGTVFYVWGAGSMLILLAASITVNYLAGNLLHRLRSSSPRAGRRLLALTVGANIAAIVVWKYGGFAADQTAALARALGLDAHWSVELVLPIAISFYTFQCISYVVDVWQGVDEPAPTIIDFAAYIVMFPHLIAGPIVRYSDIEPDLLHPSARRFQDFADGAPRFFWGLAKKVLVADQVAAIADRAFALPDNRMTTAVAWLGVAAYTVQIYFDFSGYSDMAIGLARMFGFRFPENFDRPYSATSVTDFWRRWHISLSTWFRDYVYIPLGGNRTGRARTYVNLSIVFLLTGIWHGANWTFIVWGGWHGAFMVLERLLGLGRPHPHRLVWLRRGYTMLVICLGWAIFRAVDIEQAWHVASAMLSPRGGAIPIAVDDVLTRQRIIWLIVGCAVALVPARMQAGRWISHGTGRPAEYARLATMVTLAPLACLYALSSSFSPFLYFQF